MGWLQAESYKWECCAWGSQVQGAFCGTVTRDFFVPPEAERLVVCVETGAECGGHALLSCCGSSGVSLVSSSMGRALPGDCK